MPYSDFMETKAKKSLFSPGLVSPDTLYGVCKLLQAGVSIYHLKWNAIETKTKKRSIRIDVFTL
jgi:hypothetical protein